LLAILASDFVFVEPLEISIVAFVECSILNDWDRGLFCCFESNLSSAYGSTELGCKDDVNWNVAEKLTSPSCFFFASFRKIDVNPASEAIFLVPYRFTMTEKDEESHYTCAECSTGL
jgi:hypothetical protein